MAVKQPIARWSADSRQNSWTYTAIGEPLAQKADVGFAKPDCAIEFLEVSLKRKDDKAIKMLD